MSSRNDQHLQSQTTSSHKRSKDMSSNVYSDAIESVLSFLSLKEATQLSILSKRFRHSWKFCRSPCFDRSVIGRMSKDEAKTLINSFFQINNLHNKADKFTLRFDPTDDAQQVLEWIGKSRSLSITELDLDLRRSSMNGIKFPINYDLIGRVTEKLRLVNCEIQFLNIPNNLNGYFPHLTELTLQGASISQASLGLLLVCCPSLSSLHLSSSSLVDSHVTISARDLRSFQKLVVRECSNLRLITIDAPLLNSFHYEGKFIEFAFPSAVLTRLDDAIFEFDPWRGFTLLPWMNGLMLGLSCVRVLSVNSTFVEGLSSRYEGNGEVGFGSSNLRLLRLKEFNLDVIMESFITPNDIVEFLKKYCSGIENLKIVLGINTFKNSRHWDVHGRRYMNENSINLPRLRTIKITGFTYKELPVTMVRFFLKNVQHLQDMIIVKAKDHNVPEGFTPSRLGQGLLSSSSAVNIQIIDHRKDKT